MRLISAFYKSPQKVNKESPEMYMNSQAFRPDTLYEVNLH